MNYRILFFTIGLTVFLTGSIMTFVVSAGAKQAQQQVLAKQEEVYLDSVAVRGTLFSLGIPSYVEEEDTCTHPHKRPAIITLVAQYGLAPDSCDIFINGQYTSSEHRLQPDCILECPTGEFNRPLSLGYLDKRESQDVRICCDDICINTLLATQCEDAPLEAS